MKSKHMNVQLSHLIFGCATLLLACNSKPTVVEPVSPSASQPMISDAEKSASHKVTVEEVLQATKYTYLLVREGGEPYWIAISKADVAKGETCVYTGGLKMRGFQSSELDRVFDELILVSNISRMVPGGSDAAGDLFSKMKEGEKPAATDKIVSVKGAVKISDLLSNPSRYDGKVITVTGRCTKINMQIMGRNWIHITDESGAKSELTITTQDALELGRVGVFEGKISLDKDFGAGYRYEIIMEEAVKK